MNNEQLQSKVQERMQELVVPFSEMVGEFSKKYSVESKELLAMFKVTEAQLLIVENVADQEQGELMKEMTDKMKAGK